MLDAEKRAKLAKAAQPLYDWLRENGSPYTLIFLTRDRGMVYEGEAGIPLGTQHEKEE